MTKKNEARRIRVLMSFARPSSSSNPFVSLLSDGVAASVDVRYMTLGKMVWGHFDVLHLHWPENLFRGSTVARSILKTLTSLVLLARVRLMRKPVLLTQHNLRTHEELNWFHQYLYKLWDETVSLRVYLNESIENDLGKGVTILHGDYPQTLVDPVPLVQPDSNVVRILCFGMIRRYKGLETLLEAFAGVSDATARLRIIGSVSDEAYLRELQVLSEKDPRVELLPGFVPDSELERQIASADLVVLPYGRIYNSGAALLSLSRHTPVLIPRSSATETLMAEVGVSFVQLFDGLLNAVDLEAAIHAASMLLPREKPNLSRRRWSDISSLHVKVYRWLSEDPDLSAEQLLERVAQDGAFRKHSTRNR